MSALRTRQPQITASAPGAAWTGGAAVLVMMVGALVLAGWLFQVASLKSLGPGLVTMKPNTAAAFVLAGIALWLLRKRDAGTPSRSRSAARACAAAITVLGLLTLGEYATGVDLGLDEALFRESAVQAEPAAQSEARPAFPGRMAPTTALDFVLVGTALLVLEPWGRGGPRSAQVLALTAGAVGYLALLGYGYGVSALYQVSAFSSMAVHTALAILVLAAGILCARNHQGMMAILTSRRAGGTVARRLLLAALVIPPFLGWLGLQGQARGLYDTGFGVALLVLANVVVFGGLIWWTARALERVDAARQRAHAGLERLNAELEQRVQHRTAQAARLVAILADVGAAAEIEAALRALVRGAAALLGGDEGAVQLFALPTGAPRLMLRVDAAGTVIGREVSPDPVPGSFAAAIRDGGPAVLVEDYATLKTTALRRVAERGMHASVIVPIIASGREPSARPIGSLHVNHRQPGFFTPTDLTLAAALAAQAGAVIERVRLQEALRASDDRRRQAQQRRTEQAERLAATLAEVGAADEVEAAARALARGAVHLLGGDEGVVQIFASSPAESHILLRVDASGELVARETMPDLLPGSVAATIRAGGPATLTEDFATSSVHSRLVQRGMRAAVAAPIRAGGHAIGSLHVNHHQPRRFGPEALSLAEVIAAQTGAVMARVRLQGALRASESRYRSVAQSASDAIIIADERGAIVSWDGGASAMFGYDKPEILGQSLTVLMSEQYRVRHLAGLERVRASGQTPLAGRVVALRGQRKDGREFPVELSLSTWTDAEARFFCGILRDVTERERAESAVRAANEALTVANAELEQFAHTVSHDLKQPLVSIRGFAEFLGEEYAAGLDEDGKDAVSRIVANAERMGSMIDGVLAFSLSGRTGTGQSNVYVDDVVQQTLEGLRGLIQRTGAVVEITTGVPGSSPGITCPGVGDRRLPAIVANPILMTQILDNLVANALIYGVTPGDIPRVEIAWEDLGARWRLAVRDHGPGIPPAQQDRIFGLFERLPGSRDANPAGTGVGLATVRKAARAMGGEAGVSSAPGLGATFWVELPKRSVPERQVESAGRDSSRLIGGRSV